MTSRCAAAYIASEFGATILLKVVLRNKLQQINIIYLENSFTFREDTQKNQLFL